MTRYLRGVVTAALLLLAATAAAIVIGELVLRAMAPYPGKYLTWPPHLRKIFKPDPRYIYGVIETAHFIINGVGVRGDEISPQQKYRVLDIGGSTTECLYQDQSRTWSALVERRLGSKHPELKPWVGNLGRSGFNSRHHVLQMTYEVPQLPHLDTVILLIGCNDLTLRLILGADYDPDHLTTPYGLQHQMRRTFCYYPLGFGFFCDLKDTAWWRLIHATTKQRASILTLDEYGEAVDKLRKRRLNAVKLLNKLPYMAPAMGEYGRNVNTIIDCAKKMSVRVIFLTQPSLWRPDLTKAENALLWGGGAADVEATDRGPYYSVDALTEGMAMYNKKLMEVCAQRSTECIDLAALVPKTTENFFDDVHFTDAGSQRVADIVGEYVNQTLGKGTKHR
jgi:lysophospholipase L1-like esterase